MAGLEVLQKSVICTLKEALSRLIKIQELLRAGLPAIRPKAATLPTSKNYTVVWALHRNHRIR